MHLGAVTQSGAKVSCAAANSELNGAREPDCQVVTGIWVEQHDLVVLLGGRSDSRIYVADAKLAGVDLDHVYVVPGKGSYVSIV